MNTPTSKVSVIVATYQPGDAINRVVESLDGQTLPQNDFEAVFVDDGSGDDTHARLQQLASSRPNWRVLRIDNSGWPSRPRNVGIEHAGGEYVMFMDHDDSLYPDALRHSYEYAKDTGADILTPKEAKTDDAWWALGNWGDGNIPNALRERGIDRLLPMNPHKLYRRQLLLDHKIRFPEGGRVLWEDWFINISAYRHARVVAVLADTPAYVWHTHAANTTRTFDHARGEYWDRLDDVLAHIAREFAAPELAGARATATALNFRTRILDGTAQVLRGSNTDEAVKKLVVSRARSLIERYGTPEVLQALAPKSRAQALLLRADRPDLLIALHEDDLRQRAEVHVRDLTWQQSELRIELECRWEPRQAESPILRRSTGRIVRVVHPEIERLLPADLFDVTGEAADLDVDVIVRTRSDYISWRVPFAIRESAYEQAPDRGLRLVCHGTATVDLAAGAADAPLADEVWDVMCRMTWQGMTRKPRPRYTGAPKPVLASGRAGVAYPNNSSELSIDLAQRLRSVVVDASPRAGRAGTVEHLSVPLENVSVSGTTAFDAALVAIPQQRVPKGLTAEQLATALEKLAAHNALDAQVVADDGRASLAGRAALQRGRYAIYVRRNGLLYDTRRELAVGRWRGRVQLRDVSP